MPKRKQPRKNRGRSVQELLGIRSFTRYGLLTDKGELLFFLVSPTNISVLSPINVEGKINKLQTLLLSVPGLEFLCTDASECFDDNKAYLHQRLDTERNPQIRQLLKNDISYLDDIQIEMSTARQFLFVYRCRGLKEQQVFTTANDVEKAIARNGFEVRRMQKADIKRLLALYFDASLYGEHLPDVDGEQYLTPEGRKTLLGRKPLTPEQVEEIRTKDFFDCIAPATIRFQTDYAIIGNSYRSIWAIREYPPSTQEQAILARLADRSGVTLHIYNRKVENLEQDRIINQANRRNRMKSSGENLKESVEAEGNQQDIIDLLTDLSRRSECLLHCAVYMELKAKTLDALLSLQSEITTELLRAKISVDKLLLRQKEGFQSSSLMGFNQFGTQFERVLPASGVANMYPLNFSGKTDPKGIIDLAAENTTTGDWQVGIPYLNSRYGIDLPNDEQLTEDVCMFLRTGHPDIVKSIDLDDEHFYLCLNADFCPFVSDEDEEDMDQDEGAGIMPTM